MPHFYGYVFAIFLAICALNLATCRSVVRRDISLLPLEYGPPIANDVRRTYLPPVPSRDYLPPVEEQAASLPHVLRPPQDYLPPVNNEYLPPVESEDLALPTTTTTVQPEIPTTTDEEIPTTTEAAKVTEPPTEAQTEPPQPEVEVKTHDDVVEAEEPKEEVETAVLQADGYHYRAPEIVPDLLPTKDYLPPVDQNDVPDSTEPSSALRDDGYHYRFIRRLTV